MVYGGKPSRGCRTCLARRIKCDEGKPTCQRCAKSRRICAGYRPEFEVVHRDQTSSTVRRLQRTDDRHQRNQLHHHHQHHQHHQQRQRQPPSTRHRSIIFVQEDPEASSKRPRALSPPPEVALTIPLAHRASCYFASNFVLLPLGSAPHGFMEYLVPLMKEQAQGTALYHAFNACAFALLGNRSTADGVDLSQLSLKEHTLALAQTHKALGSPTLLRADSTLAAVLLLTLYENITARKESGMLAWRTHIDGAVNIVKTRGRDELCQTPTGKVLFNSVRHHLISRTLSSGAPVPFGSDWWMSGGNTDTLFSRCQRFALAYGEVRADVDRFLVATPSSRSHEPEPLAQQRRLLRRVHDLDRDLLHWLASVPESFRFRTVGTVTEADLGPHARGGFVRYDEADAFPGRVDVYPDFVTAMAWNVARVIRMLLAALAVRLAAWAHAPADYRAAPEHGRAHRVSQAAISDIIASVPYHLGGSLNGKPLVPGAGSGRPPERLSGFVCGQEGGSKALPAQFLIWSLTCVKNCDFATEEQRAWAKGRLRFIADDVGLKYARIVNEANIRFPSMLIGPDGGMIRLSPLYGPGHGGQTKPPATPPRPANAPRTPESLASSNPSPSPGREDC
ncbi:hypothetical protein VTJ83DRAFT_6236 [Remersonia thermophila]|uniref:Zn(2)-C6 fungal-type domain-containing protein n=1 Tax=Remersonia thermophila TaxID=72144 RepID=A0ABR4D442_9PEZI